MKARALLLVAALSLAAFSFMSQGCGENDNSSPLPCCPVCGDGVCEGDENPCNCGADCQSGVVCALTVPTCGDGVCDHVGSPAESHERCPADCPLTCRACR